jgi:hypothetical protein
MCCVSVSHTRKATHGKPRRHRDERKTAQQKERLAEIGSSNGTVMIKVLEVYVQKIIMGMPRRPGTVSTSKKQPHLAFPSLRDGK